MTWVLMPNTLTKGYLQTIVKLLYGKGPGMRDFRLVSRIELPKLTEENIIAWLWSLPLPLEINAIWVSFNAGYRMSKTQFIEHYSDLWYPSSDDIFLIDEKISFILEMSHEEVFSFWKRQTGTNDNNI